MVSASILVRVLALGAGATISMALADDNSTIPDFTPLSEEEVPDPPKAIPQKANIDDLYFMPVMDFDKDGCYNVPAVGEWGVIAQGLPVDNLPGGTSRYCRDEADLDNNNVYVRNRCNHGWCVFMYAYYFEKDVGVWAGGHRHDWEHVAVWTNQGYVKFVSVSQHDKYDIRPASDVRFLDEGIMDGKEHAKVIYHKQGGTTHTMRFANEDDESIENHKGIWFRGQLLSYYGFPSDSLRNLLFKWDFGSAHLGITDKAFTNQVEKAMPSEVKNAGFNAWEDVGTPGRP